MMVHLGTGIVVGLLVVAAQGGPPQATPGTAPLPVSPPIGGVLWTVVIPALLLLGSFLATYLLYKRFAKEEGG